MPKGRDFSEARLLILKNDNAIAIDQLASFLVMEVPALIANMSMVLVHHPGDFSPAFRSPFLACQGCLQFLVLLFAGSEIMRVLNR